MEKEMRWITLWIVSNTMLALFSLAYFFLNHELSIYGVWTGSLYLCLTIFPYLAWKYNQIKFIEKTNITIQILND